MNPLINQLSLKLGMPKFRKKGAEIQFRCPKCTKPYKLEINPKNRVFYCFRCHFKGGLNKLFSYLKINPINFKEFGEFAGRSPVKILSEVLDISSKSDKLINIKGSKVADQIFEYLQKRGIDEQRAKEIDIRYSYSPKMFYRFIIPIRENNRIVSYVARTFKYNIEPKELSAFNRSEYLYNLDSINQGDHIIITEGVFDCEAIIRAGYKAIACLGTHMTQEQIGKILSKRPNSISIMFDNDDAGNIGKRELEQEFIKRGYWDIFHILLPEGKDADELKIKELKEVINFKFIEHWGE